MLQIKRSKDNRVVKCILHRIADIPGGVTVYTADLGGNALLEGTPLSKPVNGISHVVKTAKVLTNVAATDTTIEIAKGHHFKVGDFIGNGTKAKAISVINTSNAAKDVITLAAAYGTTATAGDGLVECSAADSAAKYAAFAIAGSNYDVKAGENLFVDAWIHAVVREGNAPVVDAGIKSALKNVSYL